jgi:hypothetical protein
LGRLGTEPTEDVEAAAWVVAEAVMALRTRAATATFDLWRRAATGGDALSDSERLRLEPFISTVFGTPARPAPDDHAEGYIAEVVWFLLTRDAEYESRALRKIEEPGFYVTGPGGDGLVVFEVLDGTLVFRIWEIKKHTGTAHLSATATRAMTQLAEEGASYLAQMVALADHQDAADIADLYAQLVDHWVDSAACAGAGVGIGTSMATAPKRRCFTQMATHFPGLNGGDQLEGLVVAIRDFSEFTRDVRGFVWNAL